MAEDETETTETTDDDATVASAKGHEDARWDDAPDDDAEIDEWKSYARQWEKRAKRLPDSRKAKAAEKRAADAEAKLKERDSADQTEQEKAIAKARDEAKAESASEAQAERRKDRLEVAVTRLSAKTFADTEDALLHVERAVAAGDIDPDDIFDTEGKVQTAALTTALEELLERKPHLKAAPGQLAGDGDGGKGSVKDPEDLGVAGHLAHVQGRK